MFRIIMLTVLITIGFALGGCKEGSSRSKIIDQRVTSDQTSVDDWSPGIGISSSGRLGLEVAPGVMIDTNGNLGFGMGF